MPPQRKKTEAQSQIYKINRFTTIPVLLDMLKQKRLVLLDPASWDDKNDSAILEEYKKRRNVKLFALCCTHGDETIHHWRAFADGISGCCIEFSYDGLFDLLKPIREIRLGPVQYKRIMDLKTGAIAIDDMPFTKRWPYRCEEEFRIIWEGKTTQNCFEVKFDLSIIRKITVSQRMPEAVYATIRDHLRDACDDPEKRINRSTLYQNDIWIGKFRKA